MHLALKSAMSRIPYTNKVGETLGSIADPAAAYSLRALGGGDPMVARVRRSSDDAEKDFTASDMGGALEDWVNEGYSSNLTNTWSLGNANWNFLSNTSSANQITATANSSAGSSGARLLYTFDNYVAEVGSTITATFDVTSITGGVTIKYMSSTFPSTASGGTAVLINTTGTFTYSHTITQKAYGIVAIFGADDSIDAELTSLTVSGEVVNGHVTTWYDQSGNDNHATQGTAGSQPKIVDGGTLVSDGIEFDGVDDFFDSTLTLTQPIHIFSKYKALSNDSPITGASTSSIVLSRRHTGEYIMYSGAALSGGTHPSTSVVSSALFNGANSRGYWNGVEILNGDVGSRSDFDYIGRNVNDYFEGPLEELIIYPSDQSSNREAIETNINNHYDIY